MVAKSAIEGNKSITISVSVSIAKDNVLQQLELSRHVKSHSRVK